MKTLFGVAGALVLVSAAPVSAATIIECGGGSNCIAGTTNVNLVEGDDTLTGTGNVGIGGPLVTFTTTQAGGMDLNEGAASITAGDPNIALDNLLIEILSGFTAGEFKLDPLTGRGPPAPFTVAIGVNGGALSQTFTGNQRFGILAGENEVITSVLITTPTGGIGKFSQLRITPSDVTAPVPEPGTWAMMLFGFGALGFAMRRRRGKGSDEARVRFAF